MISKCVIALDIGGTNLRFALVSHEGSILHRVHRECNISAGRQSFLDTVRIELSALINMTNDSGPRPTAIGVAIPGLIDAKGTILSSVNMKAIDGVNIKKWFEESLQLPVFVLNDANAAALAEHRYGAGRSFSSFLHLTLGTGVGSGLILDGNVWTGIDGVASEFGHLTVEPLGHLCQCGNQGCLEQYASATAISRCGAVALGIPGITTAAIADAARGGDVTALGCFHEAGRYLGIAAASVANLLNIEALIIGGGVAGSFDLFADVVRSEMKRRAFPVPGGRLRILKSELGDDAGLLGAAAAATYVP